MMFIRKVGLYFGIGLLIFSCKQKKEWHIDVPFTLQTAQVAEYEKDINHSSLISELNDGSFRRGKETYQTLCHNCHGNMVDEGSLPTAHKFWNQKFKVGNDPFSMYQTITKGFATMPPQVQLVPRQKYDVIHYIREEFMKEHNSEEYLTIDEDYLEDLPFGTSIGPSPKVLEPWADMDYGNFLINTYELVDESAPKRVMSRGKAPMADEDFSEANMAYKGIAVRLNEGAGGVAAGNAWTIFDHDLFRVSGAWSGEGFINWNGILLNGKHNVTPRTIGKLHYGNEVGPGWANPKTGSFEDPRFQARDGRRFGPLPKEWGKYKGIYHSEKHIIISYSIGESDVLEEFGLEEVGTDKVFTRTLNLENVKSSLKLRVAPSDIGVELIGSSGSLSKENGYQVLKVDAGQNAKLKLLISISPQALKQVAESTKDPVSLSQFTKGGKAHFPEVLTTEVAQMNSEGPFIVDVLTAPKDNKWYSRLRMSGIDFFNDDDKAVVCCTEGDVWLIKGLTKGEGKLTWKRIGAGLFQPLGIKVIDEEIYVTCRNQIVILRDFNNDEETDFYESFNSDHQVTDHFHEFAMGMQTDDEGNIYYAKSGRHAREALVPQHGTLLKVSKDGSTTDIIAKGFRAANGVCLNPDGSFLVTDQEGHWNPMNRINWVDKNGFYGNMFGYKPPADSSDEGMIPPMAWVDKKLDRSPSELLWVDSDKWGPFKGSLLNFSYGYGKVFLVPHEKVNGQMQGSFFQLPIPIFPTGVMRGRFHPTDGHLYACGMSAWGTQQMTEPGGLYRVRYTGEPVVAPVQINATTDGVKLQFATELDKASVETLTNYAIKTWALKRTRNYGSKHYNEKEVKLEKAVLGEDSKTVMLFIPGMKPVWQLEIDFKLKDKDGKETEGKIHSTIHNLGSESNS
ncbi:MAG: cytochrome c5/glucose/arabinose dehydrogenase [Cyclobacteriaceae bacterium]|jgi:cytochrome c5/glucose/arabinose dehydrogenase